MNAAPGTAAPGTDLPGAAVSGTGLPGTAAPGTPMAWPDMLATALVGTARAGGSPEALLDATAAQALRRRAGLALRAGVPPAPAPADEVPPVGPAAATRAGDLLALNQTGRPGTQLRDLASRLELLAEWLAAAGAAGRRLPAELVPALLDAGRRHTQLRPLIADAAGPLAGWLAGQRADWSYALATPPTEPVEDGGDAWELGSIRQRVAYLRRLRRGEPARARELLDAAWEAEPPEHRAVLLPALVVGLSIDDEPLLERALDDRRKQVRDGALILLGRLPGSRYAQRMAERARACVPVAGAGRIAISPPAECDRPMRRDGIAARPPAGTGARAWWLEEILARTPLRTWPEPAELLARTAGDEWAATLLRGLARAAAGQRAGAWAAALVDPLTTDVAATGRPDDRLLLEALYEALPATDLAVRATAALRGGLAGATTVGVEQALALCPRPWPPAVVEAVLAALVDQLSRRTASWRVTGLCELAALRMPAGAAPRVASLVDRVRADRPDDPGLTAAGRLAAALEYRHRMLEEIASDR